MQQQNILLQYVKVDFNNEFMFLEIKKNNN